MSTVPMIGQPWPEQGGIYVGSRLIDGTVTHVVIAGDPTTDIDDVLPADAQAAIVARGDINGFGDWLVPDHKDMMLAYMNGDDQFVKVGADALYWTRTIHGGIYWAFDLRTGAAPASMSYELWRAKPVRYVTEGSLE